MRSTPLPVDSFFSSHFQSQLPPDFAKYRAASDEIQKSAISLGFMEVGILQTLVRMQRRPKWVEIGTLTGFSAYCAANSLPDGGHLWTCEKDPALAAKARGLFASSGLSGRITVVEGDAAQTLPSLVASGPFDGIFIDGNKGAYALYLDWAEQNLAPGAVIVADNVFLGGALWAGSANSNWSDSVIEKMQEFLRRLFDPKKYQACIIPTGEGLAVAVKK